MLMTRFIRIRVLTKSDDKNSEFHAQRNLTINKQVQIHETYMRNSSQQRGEY